jgi:hypothetical protein
MMEQKLHEILERNDLLRYEIMLERNGLDTVDVMSELNDDDMTRLGISTMGDRKKLLKLFRTQASSKAVVDNNVVLKQDIFRAWIRKSWGISKKGSLFLYTDRLEWNNGQETIRIKDIANISVEDGLGTSILKITTLNGDKYIFQKTRVAITAVAVLGGIEMAALSDKKNYDLEIWRKMIDKLRLEGTL